MANSINLAEINAVKLENFVRPDQPSKCTWHIGNNDEKNNPHTKRPFIAELPKVIPNVLHAIGRTPLIKLNRIPQSEGLQCDMYVKAEFLNPGGSVKDRIGFRMVEDAEEKGLLKPGYTIIEPTSGNTGIGLAMASAVKGYRCIIVMPLKMSDEKVAVLTALGAEIIRTPTEAAFDDEAGLIAVAQKIQKTIPNSIVMDQYRNAGNPLAHYDTTGAEILWALDNDVDMVVLGAGTGGTVTGVARKIKEVNPKCQIVAADPEGSILAEPEHLNKTDVTFYEVEGIGYDFIPTVLDRSVVDVWIKTNDRNSLPLAKRLQSEEGLLCGGSSGTALWCALQAARTLKKGQKCVVLLPDNIRNYMTKFVQDTWVEIRGYKCPPNVVGYSWWDAAIGDQINLVRRDYIKATSTIKEASDFLTSSGLFCALVQDSDSKVIGVVTTASILAALVNGKVTSNQILTKEAFFHQLTKIRPNTTLGAISRGLQKDQFAVILRKDGDKDVIDGYVLQKDILKFVSESG